MKKRRAKLYLVGQDPADVFDDLDRLRADTTEGAERRQRSVETFARIPHDKGLALYRHRLSSAAWGLLIELDRLILKAGGRNPIPLSSKRLRAIGLKENNRKRALRQLEVAGVILVKRRGRGCSPWVFHTWYPKRS